jgi:hypothetical protein
VTAKLGPCCLARWLLSQLWCEAKRKLVYAFPLRHRLLDAPQIVLHLRVPKLGCLNPLENHLDIPADNLLSPLLKALPILATFSGQSIQLNIEFGQLPLCFLVASTQRIDLVPLLVRKILDEAYNLLGMPTLTVGLLHQRLEGIVGTLIGCPQGKPNVDGKVVRNGDELAPLGLLEAEQGALVDLDLMVHLFLFVDKVIL